MTNLPIAKTNDKNSKCHLCEREGNDLPGGRLITINTLHLESSAVLEDSSKKSQDSPSKVKTEIAKRSI